MKIAILSAIATLMQRGHEITIGPFGHVPTAVESMLKEGIEGVLILTDNDPNFGGDCGVFH